MAKKKFGSLEQVFNKNSQLNTFYSNKYKSNYDYSDIKEEDIETLVLSEEDIVINRNKINEGYFKIAKNLYEANLILASYDKTNGKFIEWFEGLGLKKTFVYNSIKRYNLYLLINQEEKINKLSQKAVEIIGSNKINNTIKIELLNEDGIENKSDRELKNYVSEIISERSEMISKEEVKKNKVIEKNKVDLELHNILEKLKSFSKKVEGKECLEDEFKNLLTIKKILDKLLN